MANTTFNGPVRSENGFEQITKNASTGAVTKKAELHEAGNASVTSSDRGGALLLNSKATDGLVMQTYQASITVANGQTTGKEASIGMPANFMPMAVMVTVDTASTNAVNLNDIGDDGDTDSYCDGLAIAVNSTGFKGIFGCNGVRGLGTGTTGALTTADEVEVVLSGDPGAATSVLTLTFLGILGTQTLDLSV